MCSWLLALVFERSDYVRLVSPLSERLMPLSASQGTRSLPHTGQPWWPSPQNISPVNRTHTQFCALTLYLPRSSLLAPTSRESPQFSWGPKTTRTIMPGHLYADLPAVLTICNPWLPSLATHPFSFPLVVTRQKASLKLAVFLWALRIDVTACESTNWGNKNVLLVLPLKLEN